MTLNTDNGLQNCLFSYTLNFVVKLNDSTHNRYAAVERALNSLFHVYRQSF